MCDNLVHKDATFIVVNPCPSISGRSLLEQFQAQVAAALRPAFGTGNSDLVVSPELTGAACHTCAAWLASGVPRAPDDLRRVHSLLRGALQASTPGLDTAAANSKGADNAGNNGSRLQRYNEVTTTRLQLAVLSAWAELFVAAHLRFREGACKDLARAGDPNPVAAFAALLATSEGDDYDDDDEDITGEGKTI